MDKEKMGYIYQFCLLGLISICIVMDFIYTKKINEIMIGAIIGLMIGINSNKISQV